MATDLHFLAGVIEGFYGQPWSQAERFELFDWMASWGLNTYFYAPKDDLKHRTHWRELYTASEAANMGRLIRGCQQRNIGFIYALSPGLDIRYSDEAELDHLKKRFDQMLQLGCQHFALLFDDIPDRLNAGDFQRWGSLGSAQCHVTNQLFKWTQAQRPQGRFLFCPTAYCGRMAERQRGGKDYLAHIGRELWPEIDALWTGPEIISREITAAHVQEWETVLRRKPVIWDNLHANDYDGRRFFCGPYTGRPPELRGAVSGLLSNPNNEFLLNYVPLCTLAEFVRCEGFWDARQAYLSAMRGWLPRFAAAGEPLALEDLILFGDCYYLPHEEGPEAEAFHEGARVLLTGNTLIRSDRLAAFRRETARLRQFCTRLTEIRDRPLFHALSRRIWELREELDLLDHFVDMKFDERQSGAPCRSDSHLPGTYRGGMAARLQRLLVQQPDGSFTAADGAVK